MYMPIVVTVHIVPAGCVFGYNLQLLLSHLRQLCSQLTPFFRKQAINMTCCTNDGMPMVVDVRFNRIRCCILCLRVVFSPQFAALAAIYPKPILTFFFQEKSIDMTYHEMAIMIYQANARYVQTGYLSGVKGLMGREAR
jgi:hypothetical protein